MHKIGIVSDQFTSDNEFKIDFKKFKEYGFDSLDFQGLMYTKNFDYSIGDIEFDDYFKRLKVEVDKHGLIVNQLHALWDQRLEEEKRDNLLSYYIRALKAAYILNTPYVVIHPISPKSWFVPFTTKEITDANMEFFKKLIPYAVKYNTKIAIENLPFTFNPDFFSPLGTYDLVKKLNNDNIVMCLDTGHMNIYKSDPYELIIKIKDKLKVLHLHDNNTHADSHSFPYMGRIDWDKVMKGLKDIGFEGVLSFETSTPKKLPENIFNELTKALVDIIHLLRSKIDD